MFAFSGPEVQSHKRSGEACLSSTQVSDRATYFWINSFEHGSKVFGVFSPRAGIPKGPYLPSQLTYIPMSPYETVMACPVFATLAGVVAWMTVVVPYVWRTVAGIGRDFWRGHGCRASDHPFARHRRSSASLCCSSRPGACWTRATTASWSQPSSFCEAFGRATQGCSALLARTPRRLQQV